MCTLSGTYLKDLPRWKESLRGARCPHSEKKLGAQGINSALTATDRWLLRALLEICMFPEFCFDDRSVQEKHVLWFEGTLQNSC